MKDSALEDYILKDKDNSINELVNKEIEDKAREKAEERVSNPEITKIMDYYPQAKGIKTQINNYSKNNKMCIPFLTSFNL